MSKRRAETYDPLCLIERCNSENSVCTTYTGSPTVEQAEDVRLYGEVDYDLHLKEGLVFPLEYYGTEEYRVRSILAANRARLVSLQPQVRVDDNTLEAALILLSAYGQTDNCSIASCMWLAMKLLAVRTAAPCRSLLCAAACIQPAALSWRELEVCKVLDWDLSSILREAGIVR